MERQYRVVDGEVVMYDPRFQGTKLEKFTTVGPLTRSEVEQAILNIEGARRLEVDPEHPSEQYLEVLCAYQEALSLLA